MPNLTGWLTPRGNFYECGLYEHLSVLAGHDELTALVPNFHELKNWVDCAAAGCQANIEAEEHPSWHCFEMAQDDANYEIRKQLVEAGCLRVGTHGKNVHFEGKPDAATMQAAKDLAEEHGKEAVFDKVRI